jgi:hypothetical protein
MALHRIYKYIGFIMGPITCVPATDACPGAWYWQPNTQKAAMVRVTIAAITSITVTAPTNLCGLTAILICFTPQEKKYFP